jgi:hypothetical protein
MNSQTMKVDGSTNGLDKTQHCGVPNGVITGGIILKEEAVNFGYSSAIYFSAKKARLPFSCKWVLMNLTRSSPVQY